MGRKHRLSWSRNRAAGMSEMKNRMARKMGIPTTRGERRRKVGRLTGCGVLAVTAVATLSAASLAMAAGLS